MPDAFTIEPEDEGVDNNGQTPLKSDTTDNGDSTETTECEGSAEIRNVGKSLQLSWSVIDYDGITSNIYEAVMVAAHRARQVGRRQKREIDNWNITIEMSEITPEEEDAEEPGIDHFNHPKPTVQAMHELKSGRFDFRYPDEEEK